MIETEYFQGHSVDEPKKSWADTIIEILCFACLGVLLAMASGCATEAPKSSGPRHEFCQMLLLGHTASGMSVVEQACVTPEEFEKSQQ